MNLQYIINEKGERVSAIVPFKQWEELTTSHEKLQAKLNVLLSIQEGMQEVQSRKNLQTLESFLNESCC